MDREVRRVLWALWATVAIVCIGGAALGIAAGDPGMVWRAAGAALGGLVAAPFVARMWRGGGDRMG
jgi:hypothetical protein